MPKSDLHKGNPLRKTSTSRNQNLKRGGAKQFLFADGIWSTGVSDNHSPKELPRNTAPACEIPGPEPRRTRPALDLQAGPSGFRLDCYHQCFMIGTHEI